MFALDSGIAVPPDLLVSLERAFSCVPGGTAVTATGQRSMTAVSRDERSEVATVSMTPTEWTGSNETPVPMDCSQQISLLGGVHLALGKLVAPACPGTLMLLYDERRKHPFLHSFGAVPLSRKMLVLAGSWQGGNAPRICARTRTRLWYCCCSTTTGKPSCCCRQWNRHRSSSARWAAAPRMHGAWTRWRRMLCRPRRSSASWGQSGRFTLRAIRKYWRFQRLRKL